jgi:tetraacyldisaccharide 4'-kinase
MRGFAERLYGAAWELRRRAYAAGWRRPRAVGARVVSIGNLTVGGTGKTTLTLHLAARALERGLDAAVVCRRYRPGPGGEGDEERLYRAAVGEGRVFAGRRKLDLAAAAAAAGKRLVLVDDGFSHWALERDLDVVLLDSTDPWGGRRLLPAGRLREPLRALQRAGLVILTRLAPGADADAALAEARRRAPGARFAAGRHRVTGARMLAGGPLAAGSRVWLVTATGNPAAVEASAREAGFELVGGRRFRDHHWFRADERAELRRAAAAARARLLMTPKDAMRWPAADPEAAVLDVEWAWVSGGAEAERMVFGEAEGT